MGVTLFISYRRGDTAGWAGSLHRDLASLMGPDATIFMDVDGIPPGEDFGKYIDQSVGQCDALIALIGPRWAGVSSDGTRRIDNPDDFVRLEVASALQRGIRVIPIQVDDAALPGRDELPDPLKPLRDRQAIEVDNTTWDSAITRLVASFDTTKPKLAVSPAQLDFGAVPVNAPWPRRTVQLRNEGGGELRPSASSSQSWIIVRNRGDALDILIDTSREGDYNGVVNVQSAGGRFAVPVTAVVSPERSVRDTSAPPANQTPAPAPTPTPSPPTFSMPGHMRPALETEKVPSNFTDSGATHDGTGGGTKPDRRVPSAVGGGLVALLLAGGVWFVSLGDDTERTISASTAATATGSATTSAPGPTATGSPAPTETPGPLLIPPRVPESAVACSDTVFAGPKTSCPFALNVEAGWQASGRGTVRFKAFSPVTQLQYDMRCEDGQLVVCRAQTEAIVYIRP